MSSRRKLTAQSVWDCTALLKAFDEAGVRQWHAWRLWSHLVRHPSAEWTDVPDLPKAAVALLNARFVKLTSKVVTCQTSADGETSKLLVELQDGARVEAVVMHYDTTARFQEQGDGEQQQHGQAQGQAQAAIEGPQGPGIPSGEQEEDDAASDLSALTAVGREAAVTSAGDVEEVCSSSNSLSAHNGPGRGGGGRAGRRGGVTGHRRATLCVSSQIGCQMGCTFCATGTMGLKGNLTEGEILEQLVHANTISRVRNIVFMGMGEPLSNYDPVVGAVRAMTHPQLFGLARRHVTISTVGVIPRLKTLHTDLPGVSLALSLHAPNQELRLQIVPSARAYKLDRLMEVVKEYEVASGLRVFFEYVMLDHVNDGPEQAHELGVLLKPHKGSLNLIPWNPVAAEAAAAAAIESGGGPAPLAFAAPAPERVAAFQAILRDTYNIPTTVRQEKGQDISGACGQLVLNAAQQAAAIAAAAAAKAAPAKAGECGSSSCGCDGDDVSDPGAKGHVGVRDIEELAH